METVALLEFDLKCGPTIVRSCGEIDIPKKLVNWALQALEDNSYTTGPMEGYFVGGVKFTLRDPSTEERGGRRSFSFLLVSDKEIQGFGRTAERILEWVHTRVDGKTQQAERLEEILRQLVEQEPIMTANSPEGEPKQFPLNPISTPKKFPITPIDSLESVPKITPAELTSLPTGSSSCEQVTVKSIQTQTTFPENYFPQPVFEEDKFPLISFIACQWTDTAKHVKVRLQIGSPLPTQHLRILTMFSLGCERDREAITLSFGRFFVRRISDNTVLIGQPDSKNLSESTEFFDILGDVLTHFPKHVTFFLNLFRKNRSVYLSFNKGIPKDQWATTDYVADSYVKGLEKLIMLMNGSLSLEKMAETLQPEYSFLEILYMIVVLNNLGMVEIHAT